MDDHLVRLMRLQIKSWRQQLYLLREKHNKTSAVIKKMQKLTANLNTYNRFITNYTYDSKTCHEDRGKRVPRYVVVDNR